MSRINPQALTLVSGWGERGQIGKADVNAACAVPLERGPGHANAQAT
ncbi:TPA: hypothetical protein M4K80_002205 [Salmonella enterica]|nr:hypothetical protein [Salmonella enterica]